MTAANPVSVLSVRKLTVRFGNKTVIHDLTFDVTRGENLAIIGPNGAGKTVLLRALLNQLPYEGAIEWAPETKLGYVPQAIAADLLRQSLQDLAPPGNQREPGSRASILASHRFADP